MSIFLFCLAALLILVLLIQISVIVYCWLGFVIAWQQGWLNEDMSAAGCWERIAKAKGEA